MPNDSDSDDDSDYVPPKNDGPDGSDASDLDSDAPTRKRARTEGDPQHEGKDQRTGTELWAEFKASIATPAAPPATPLSTQPEMVKIEKRYRFAGEEIVEVKEIPADSKDAQDWPLWVPTGSSDRDVGTSQGSAIPPAAGASISTETTPKSAPRRVGPRKSKTILGAIPKKQTVKKLSTLDKSAMDWRAHVEGEAEPGMKDELEANRRGGGYLAKVEFLQRVEARKEEVLDASKGKRKK